MTDIEKTEEPQTIDAAKAQNITAEDWGFDAESFAEEVEATEPEDEAGEPEEELELAEEEIEEEAEEVEQAEVQPKKKRGVNARFGELTQKLKDKDTALEALQREMQNLKAGLDYLKPKQEVTPQSLDERLVEAAKQAQDSDFDLDDFTTDAEKKTALIAYKNVIQNNQTLRMSAIQDVKNTYIAEVQKVESSDPALANGFVMAYNAAVENEAIALTRRYSNLTETDAMKYAEQNLLEEARNTSHPVDHIADFGMKLLQKQVGTTQKLTKVKEKGTIDHKNRETIQQRAGKPEIDTAPVTKRSVEAAKRYDQVAAEW